jgi:glycosyltransferase involved in cell wall biosynthesis
MQDATCLHATSAQEAEAYWPNMTNRLVVLFMSRLSLEKDLDLLIPIWADLLKSVGSIKLEKC